MSCTLADKNRRKKMLRSQLAGINDPYELLAEVIADNERLRQFINCLLYTSPSPRDLSTSRMPSSA